MAVDSFFRDRVMSTEDFFEQSLESGTEVDKRSLDTVVILFGMEIHV